MKKDIEASFREKKEQIKFEKELKKAERAICSMGIIRDMDNVLNFDAFKVEAENKILESSGKGILFMGDIDNLSTVSHIIGDEKANVFVRDIIKQIKEKLADNKISEYEIGKLGDELYVYAHNTDEENAHRVLEGLNNIKNEYLTISFGATGNLNHGLEKAISIADERMRVIKDSKKIKAMDGKSKDEILTELYNSINSKLRIDPNNLTGAQLKTYRKNIIGAITNLINGWKEGKKETKKDNTQTIDELDLRRRISDIRAEYENKYPHINLNERQLKEICISKMLTKTPLKTVRKVESFKRKGYRKLIGFKEGLLAKIFPRLTKKITLKKLQNTGVMTIDLGNIKHVNDTLGHCECDQLVYSLIEKIMRELKESKIKTRSEYAYSRGISSYYVLVNTGTPHSSLEKFKEKVKELRKNSKFTLNVSEVTPMIPNNASEDLKCLYEQGDLPGLVKQSFDSAVQENEKFCNQMNLEQKINRTDAIGSAVEKNELIIKKLFSSNGEQLNNERLRKILDQAKAIDIPTDEAGKKNNYLEGPSL